LSYSSFTDDELLDAIRQSDQVAFAELFKRYWKKIYGLTRARVRSEETTQEIVQELFISLWEKRSSLTITHVPSYLYAATKNRILNRIASQMVEKKHWDYYKGFIPESDNVTENDVELDEMMGALQDGVEHLPEKTKKIFKLTHMDGLSIPEIADLLHLSEKAIQYHVTQSVKKLRLHLKDYILFLQFFITALLPW
jgi:RNA polymerase sigma-70 factor (family 1)